MKNKSKYIILIVLIFLFTLITYLVKTNKIVNFDNYVYEFLNDKSNSTLTSFFRGITLFANYQAIVILCILSFVFIRDKVVDVEICIVSILSATMNSIFKSIFVRPRPDVLKLITQGGYSYPSGHAMASMTFYGFLIYLIYKSDLSKNKKISFITLLSIFILLIGMSRIYLGVHYASDIIAGYIVSVILLIIYVSIINKISETR